MSFQIFDILKILFKKNEIRFIIFIPKNFYFKAQFLKLKSNKFFKKNYFYFFFIKNLN